jgi:hypothetical protein
MAYYMAQELAKNYIEFHFSALICVICGQKINLPQIFAENFFCVDLRDLWAIFLYIAKVLP